MLQCSDGYSVLQLAVLYIQLFLVLTIEQRYHRQRGKGKAIPLQAWTGPEVSRRLRLQDFKTIGT
jgi:hypothetical protein